jgi:hypothetical protein
MTMLKKKVEILLVGWHNYKELNLNRGEWVVTTVYFLGVPIYRNYKQLTYFK